MRIGVIWDPVSAAHYRAVEPMKAMAARGHEIVWPTSDDGAGDLRRLAGCDVVQVYRRHDDETARLVSRLQRGGAAVVYDNDDDFRTVPRESPLYRQIGGRTGARIFTRTVEMASMAQIFTTTTSALAEAYRGAGVDLIEVIDNAIADDATRRTPAHDGVVVGWVAGMEHLADVARVPIAHALEAVQRRHPDVRVECIGVDLRLPERYRHDGFVPFVELPARVAGFDIGIAPLAQLPINDARSSIKVKEYAAAGVAWLASPVGPYRELGEDQGGRLVDDDGWEEAIARLVTGHRERRKLGKRGRRWSKSQSIRHMAGRWEHALMEAVSLR